MNAQYIIVLYKACGDVRNAGKKWEGRGTVSLAGVGGEKNGSDPQCR